MQPLNAPPIPTQATCTNCGVSTGYVYERGGIVACTVCHLRYGFWTADGRYHLSVLARSEATN